MTQSLIMSPQSYKSHITTKAMASNGYSGTGTPAESKNHSSPCELFNCMCA